MRIVRHHDPTDRQVVPLVAARMGATLAEVLGPKGRTMYTPAWLEDRLRWHLDPATCDGALFLALTGDGPVAEACVGHTLVRHEVDDEGPFGLFSTTWVHPDHRRHGVADRLLDAGEAWLLGPGPRRLATATDAGNEPLIRLFERRGYTVRLRRADLGMVRLEKRP